MPSVRKSLSRWTRESHLRGLPEMSLFPDDDARERAIEEIYEDSFGWGFVASLVVQAAIVAGVFFLVAYAIKAMVPWIVRWSGHISLGIVTVGYLVFLFFALRISMVRDLRRKLIEIGVPVCLKCGYDLRGLDEPRCPECGREADAPARN